MMNDNLPKEFISRMTGQLGHELPDFLRSYDDIPKRGIRFNPLKVLEIEKIDSVLEPVMWEKNSHYLRFDSTAGNSIFHEAGAFYIQEPSAMLPASVMNAQPGEWILDLCSAPGGKSTQIGVALQGKGMLVSNEPIPKRAQILSRNIERLGITNALVTCAYPDRLAAQWPECFDGVQVDAPCSGEGMFRRHPETRQEWSMEMAAGCAERQKAILGEAAKLVRRGGRIVYSTCTMNPLENEKMVQWFLDAFPCFEREDFQLPGIQSENGMFMLYPHRIKGEGQFVALLRKKGNSERNHPGVCSFPAPSREETKVLKEFDPESPLANGKIGTVLFSLPECPDTGKIKILRAGVHLGEAKGKNFFPDHAWAVAAIRHNLPICELNETSVLRYFAGETVSGNMKGWQLISYHGMVLGWGKGSDGIIKNHYPKGLRKDLTSKDK